MSWLHSSLYCNSQEVSSAAIALGGRRRTQLQVEPMEERQLL